jgi:hypothetical protein
MAHFAEIDDDNIVLRVIVVNNNELLDNGLESEEKGILFCKSLFGENTNWVQTSYNNSFRKQYALGGFTYDKHNDIFLSPQPFVSWILDPVTFNWKPPIEYPKDNKYYIWDESAFSWVENIFNIENDT